VLTASRSIVRIVRDAVAGGSPRERRALALVVLTWILLVALQAWDVAGRSGPEVSAELLGVVVLTLGSLLLAATALLSHDVERSAREDDAPAAPREIVLALPVLAGVSATCLGFACAMFVTRALLGTSLWAMLGMSVLVLATVALALGHLSRSTRALYAWAHDRAAAAARAEAEADRARLTALQAQMNPHFLFNALNTIAALAGEDPARAERTVENLSMVLRRTLERSGRAVAALDDEIAFLRQYLDVERERFGPRLAVNFQLAPGTGADEVPTMSLQPLVENALKYAVATRIEGGSLTIAASRAGSELHVSVADDGEGFQPGTTEGTGLGNLRARLRALYQDRSRLVIESSGAGTRVTIVVPVAGQEAGSRPCAS
jgi:signal transduction histidine kinase